MRPGRKKGSAASVVLAAEEAAGLQDLDSVLAIIRKEHGAGSVMRLKGDYALAGVEAIPTGFPSLDAAFGIGGMPKGRIIEVFGNESAGKTTLATCLAAAAQRATEKLVAIVDAEHAFDPAYAERIGLDTERTAIAQPDCGEQGLEITHTMIETASFAVVVVDSVAALTPRAEIEGHMGDQHVGLQARLMSQAMRKLNGVTAKTGTTLIFINQIRHKIGQTWGNPEDTPGGKALKFYASVRLDIRRIGAIKQGEEVIGSRVRVKLVKNKVSSPFREAELDLRFAFGLDPAADVFDCAVVQGVIEQSGSWYSLDGERLAQGRDNAVQLLRDDAELLSAVTALL